MLLEEARQVKWTRVNPRPMGELLDEGFLTEKDLEWAANRAYSPAQKQAAQVLLAAIQTNTAQPTVKPSAQQLPPELDNVAYAIHMTMDKVRATEWPFSPYKGEPMGALVDKQQLSLKDLAFAIEIAWDQRVRQASIALLLTRLKQVIEEPPPEAGNLHVVSSGRSFSQRQEFFWVFTEAALLGIVFGLVLAFALRSMWTIFTVPQRVPSDITSPIYYLLLIGAGLLIGYIFNKLLAFVLNQVTQRIDRQIRFYRKGQEGEERVVNAIHTVLDGNWHLFRNVELPGRNKADLDSILVGPSGVWALEVKTLSSDYRNIGEDWQYRTKSGKWKLEKNSPSRQANKNAARLAGFLKADGIQQWVTPVVVWANPEAQIEVQNPSVTVWTIDHLPDELSNIWQKNTLPEDKRKQITDKLTQLCQQQQAARLAELAS